MGHPSHTRRIPVESPLGTGHGDESHGGAWKVAYADMTTALMALFIVLWILGQSDDVKESVQQYFRDPIGFEDGGDTSVLEGAGIADNLAAIEELLAAPARSDSEETPVLAELWGKRAEKIRNALERMPSFEDYRDQVELALTPEGLQVSLIEDDDSPLFEVGGVELSREAVALLEVIGEQVKNLNNHLVIEGHTDSRPFGPSARMTNWELSTGRAQTARRLLARIGVEPERILEVRGFADRQLYNPRNPEDSRNRRISITLLSEEASAFRTRKEQPQVLEW